MKHEGIDGADRSFLDLGGLAVPGGSTGYDRFLRVTSDDLAAGSLSAAVIPDVTHGGSAGAAPGVATAIDLTRLDERMLVVLHADAVPSLHGSDAAESREDQAGSLFGRQWTRLMSSPVYYPDSLERFPEAVAAVFRAFAAAPEGAVAFFCREGVDHTGLVAALLLKLVGVADTVIADVIASVPASAPESAPAHPATPVVWPPADGPAGEPAAWAAETRAPLLAFLSATDVEALLLGQGVSREELHAIRRRFLA